MSELVGVTRNLPGVGEHQAGTARALMRDASRVLTAAGYTFTPAELRVVVARFLDTGHPTDDLEAWVLSYADPTGETAVRNVTRGGRR